MCLLSSSTSTYIVQQAGCQQAGQQVNFAELLNEAAEDSARLRSMSNLALGLLSLLLCRSCNFVDLLLGFLEQCKSLGTVCGPANSCRAAQESLAGEQSRGESGHDPCAMSKKGVNTLELHLPCRQSDTSAFEQTRLLMRKYGGFPD